MTIFEWKSDFTVSTPADNKLAKAVTVATIYLLAAFCDAVLTITSVNISIIFRNISA